MPTLPGNYMVSNATKIKRTTLAIGVVLAAALLLRAINLDADPSALISRDVITDEGWWAHNARNAVLYGQWRVDDHNLGLYSAYLYNALIYIAFETLGVSLTATRMLSALAGWLTIVLLFLMVRREISSRAAVIASVLLGFSNLHIIYSRAGFAESTMVFFLALAVLLWSLRRNHPLFAFASGIAFALMLLTKVTAIHILAGLALVIGVEAIRRSTARLEIMAFGGGMILVICAYGILFIAPNFHGWLEFNAANGSGSEWPSSFAGGIYSILKLLGSSFYRKAPLITALTLLSLSVLVIDACRIGLLNMIRGARELEIICASLLIGYLASLSFTVYQPERRFLPALFLMVVVSAGGLETGWRRLEVLDNPDNRVSAIGWFAVLCFLPALGILSLRLPAAPAAGFLAVKLISIAGLIGVAIALSRGRLPHGFKRGLLTASRLTFVLLFYVLSIGLILQSLELWGVDARSWAANNLAASIAFAAVLLASVVALAGLVRDSRAGKQFLIVGFLIVEGVQISTWLLQPTYTLKETSASLADILTRDDTVVTNYETALLQSNARVICRSLRRGLNLDVFEMSSPQYMLVLRRDNWRDYALEEMSPEEWPPPAYDSTKAASFELCPVPLRGPRFVLELYTLHPKEKRRKKSRIASGIDRGLPDR